MTGGAVLIHWWSQVGKDQNNFSKLQPHSIEMSIRNEFYYATSPELSIYHFPQYLFSFSTRSNFVTRIMAPNRDDRLSFLYIDGFRWKKNFSPFTFSFFRDVICLEFYQGCRFIFQKTFSSNSLKRKKIPPQFFCFLIKRFSFFFVLVNNKQLIESCKMPTCFLVSI